MAKKQKTNVVFIRCDKPAEKKLIEDLKKQTNNSTSTGAFMSAGRDYLLQVKEIATLEKEIEALNNRLRDAEEVLKFIHAGQNMLNGYAKKFPKGKYPEPDLF